MDSGPFEGPCSPEGMFLPLTVPLKWGQDQLRTGEAFSPRGSFIVVQIFGSRIGSHLSHSHLSHTSDMPQHGVEIHLCLFIGLRNHVLKATIDVVFKSEALNDNVSGPSGATPLRL